MTEFELMELIQGVYDKMGVDATMYFTLVSAFLVVAFLAGDKLSTKQLFIVIVLYVFWVLGNINSMYTGMLLAEKLENSLVQMGSTYYGDSSTAFWVLFFMVIQAGGILASLYFMWSVRHPASE